MPISRTVHWTLLANLEEALKAVADAVSKAKFKIESQTPGHIKVDVPRSLLLNQWAAKIEGAVEADGDRTHIRWTVEGLGDKHFAHIGKIAKGLPDGMLYDRGIPALMARTLGIAFAIGEISHLPNVMDRGETVLAMAVGKVNGKSALGVVTDSRVFFLEKGLVAVRESLTAFDLSVIQAVHTAKSAGGESLTITYSGMTAVMTHIPHGAGDTLAEAIRSAKASHQTSAPAAQGQVQNPDVIGQLERLASLRSQGVLTEDEFQDQKSSLLAKG